MKSLKKNSILAVAAVALIFTACKKDDDSPVPATGGSYTPPNDVEILTSLIISFEDTAGVQPSVNYAFRDPDGTGGDGPTEHDTIRLAANTFYNATVQVLNESDPQDIEDVTLEVLDEDDEHLFCYDPSNTNVSVTRTDSDGTYEIGITSRWSTGTAANGSTMITLKHQPGVKNGNCAPGETDIEVTFVTEIQ